MSVEPAESQFAVGSGGAGDTNIARIRAPLSGWLRRLPSFLKFAVAAFLGLAYASSAFAYFHLWRINEIYSNANGTVQYIELTCAPSCASSETLAKTFNVTITVSPSGGGTNNVFAFPTDLATPPVLNQKLLIATQGFAAMGIAAPDYIIPDGFLFVGGGTMNLGGFDIVNYTALPTNGVLSVDRFGATATNSPTNYAGVAGTLSGGTLWIRFNGNNQNEAVRSGQTMAFSATLTKPDGTIIEGVSPTWSVVSGPVTINSSSGVVTGGVVGVDTQATIQASFTDAVLTGGAPLIATRAVTVQASPDYWTGGRTPGQGGDARGFTTVGSDILVNVYGGGIYRTSNGVNWIQTGYGIPFRNSAFVRNLFVIPNTTTQLLASVEGRGIYRSSDGGTTWTASNSGMGCNFPRGFQARAATNTLYVASNCGVYKSLDSGNTWAVTGLTQPVSSIWAFSNSDTVWAMTPGNGLYRTLDAGATWTQMNNGLSGPNGLHAYAFRNLGSGVLLTMIEGSGIFKSNDGGANWATANSGLPAVSSYSFQGGTIALEDNHLYISVEGYGIYRGTNGGTVTNPITWSAWGNTATQLPLRQRPPDLINGVYHAATGQGVFKSSDNGVTWTKYSAGLPGGFAHTSVTDPTNTSIVYAVADTVYKSTDGGATWVKSATGITSAHSGLRGSNGTILRRGDGALYVSTANGGIWKSVNGAATWAPVNTGLPAIVGQGIAVRGGLTSAPQTLFALFPEDPRGVYMTVNGGTSWANISGDLAGNALYTNTIAVDPANGDLYLGTEGGVYKSVNGGTNWTAVYTANPVSTVRIDTGTNPSDVYFSTYVHDAFHAAQAASGLYRSAGGAAPVQLLTNRLVRNFRALRPGGQLTLYVASWNNNETEAGVFKSTNGGATWQSIKSGLDHRYVQSFDPVGDRIMHASARGRGVYTFVGPVDVALAGIQAGLDAFKAIVNAHTGANDLDYTHLLSGYDAGFLAGGINATTDAKIAASDFRGGSITSFTVTGINSYDEVNGIINAFGTISGTSSEGPFNESISGNSHDGSFFIFKRQGDGSYKMYGDQRLADISVQVEMRTDYMNGTTTGPRQHVNFHINALAGVFRTSVNSHTATATPNNWSGASPPNQLPQYLYTGSTFTENFQGSPPPAPGDTLNWQSFYGGFDPLATPVSNGQVFQFTLTKLDSSTVSYNVPFFGTALTNPGTDAITNLTINGTTNSVFPLSLLSSPLNLAWTLPTGFPIQELQLWGYVQNSNNEQCQVNTDVVLPANATSGQITLPSTCGAFPIVRGGVNVTANGMEGSGHRAMFIYGFDITSGPAVNLTINHVGPNTGAVTVSPTGQVCSPGSPGSCTYSIPSGTVLNLGASSPSPSTPGIFSGGTGSATGCTASTCSFTITQNSALTVTWDGGLGPFPTLTVTAAGSGTGTVGIPGYGAGVQGTTRTFAPGSVVTLTASPTGGSTFGGFSGACVSGTTTCSFTITTNSTVTGTFTAPSTLALATFGGPMAAEEGSSYTFGTYLLKADNTTVPVNATWSGGSPASISASGVLTVPPSVVSANTGTTLTATFSDPTLTGGQTVTASRSVIIQDGTEHWVGNNQPGQGGDIRQLLTISDAGATTLVALVYGRGIWRSTNSGANWLPANIGIGERQVRSAAVLDTNTLVLGTEAGVYRSVTRGGSWLSSNSGLASCTNTRGVARGSGNNVVYLGTNNCGVYRSTDAGVTWTPFNNGLPAGTSVVNLSASTTSDFVAIGTAGSGAYRSTGGGWEAINTGLTAGPHGNMVTRIFTDPSFYLANVEGSGVFRSSSNPVSWTPVIGLPTGRSYGPFLRFTGSPDIYVGVDGVGTYKSVDNGVSWTLLAVAGVGSRRTGPVPDPNVAGTQYFYTAAGVYKSADSGANWSKASSGLPGGHTTSSSTDPNDPNIVVATADTVYRSTDGGTTWAVSNTGISGHNAISPGSVTGGVSSGSLLRNAAGLFVSTTNYGVFKSTDNGLNWASVHGTMPPAVGQGVLVRPDATNSSGLFAVYQNYEYGAYRTSDGGASWQSITGDLPAGNARMVRFVAADPNALGTLYAATRAGLYKSINGGTNWTLLPNTSSCSPGRVRVDAGTNPSTIYWSASCGEANTLSGVYRITSDGTQTQLLSSEPIFDLRVVRPAGVLTLWVSSQNAPNYFNSTGNLTWVGKVLRSTDGGVTWIGVNAGLQPMRPRGFEVNSTGSLVRLHTAGAGLYTLVASNDTQPPSIPAGVTAVSGGATQITVGWVASTDNIGVQYYKVFRNGVLAGTVIAPTVSFNDTGLTTGVTYNYTIEACDAAGNCSALSSQVSASPGDVVYMANLELGFNLISNALNITINVPATFGNADTPVPGISANVVTIWKWVITEGVGRWAFHSPQLTAAANATFAASKGYDVLTAINAGEGYWVNSITPMTLPAQSGAAFNWNAISFGNLPSGFNLITQANSASPSQFNSAMSLVPPSPGQVPTDNFLSLWAWDALNAKWYFYSPLLEAAGGLQAVKDYADSHFYLHFQDFNKQIGLGVGFWVNRP